MSGRSNVPFWYKFQSYLLTFQPTKWFLLQYYRVQKRLYKIKEHYKLKHQPNNLRNFEKRIYSQNGEDGMLQEIFHRIGTTNNIFVEFGVQDGKQCCTRNLLENHAWKGVWIECSKEDVANAQQFFKNRSITIIERFLTPDNIVSVFQEAKIPEEFDLMVVDIDGNDYWMWYALAGIYRPRVIVTEYNGTFGPKEEWIMPCNPQHIYDETAFFGASLTSFAKFGLKHGYRLVGCDSQGVNAFFVREDVAEGRFDGLDQPPAFHYVAPYYDVGFGHLVSL